MLEGKEDKTVQDCGEKGPKGLLKRKAQLGAKFVEA